MNSFEFQQPEFLLCEIGIKDSTLLGDHILNDERLWVHHLPSSSLIEFVFMNELGSYNFREKHREFTYLTYRYTGFYVKNNCALFNQSEDIVLNRAWEYLEDFLTWEDREINRHDFGKLMGKGNDYNIN